MTTLYMVQQHSENDNGPDRIDLFEDKESAIERFDKRAGEYTAAYGDDMEDERWELEDDGLNVSARRVWELPDGTTAAVYLSDITPFDSK